MSKVESILAADTEPTTTTTAVAPTPIDAEGNFGKGDIVPPTKGEEAKKGSWVDLFKK